MGGVTTEGNQSRLLVDRGLILAALAADPAMGSSSTLQFVGEYHDLQVVAHTA